MPGMSSTWFALAGVLAVAASADAADPAPAAARGNITVTLVEGSATSTAKGATAPRPLASGDELAEGEIIQTGADGRLELLLDTGSILRFGPSTRSELSILPKTGGSFRLKLVAGNFWAKVAKLLGTDKFEVETENGVSGVRGTEFRIEVGTAGNQDLLRCYDGAVQVAARDGKWTHRVEPGSELTFNRFRGSAGPRRFDPRTESRHPFMSWVRRSGPRAHPVQRRGPDRRTPGMRPVPGRNSNQRTPGYDRRVPPGRTSNQFKQPQRPAQQQRKKRN
jgi:hypothetical protein